MQRKKAKHLPFFLFPYLIVLTPLLFFCFSACTVGPDYVRPAAVIPAHYKEAEGKKVMTANKNWKTAEPQDAIDRGEWWKIFKDTKLNQLETQLNLSNQNIINAEQNYRQ